MQKRKDNGVHLPWNEQVFIDAWQEWLQYRSERRLPTYKPTGLKKTFEMLVQISQNDFNTAVQIGDEEMRNSFGSEDFKEGVAHFVERRAPRFTGR